jgi:hypothetical protein
MMRAAVALMVACVALAAEPPARAAEYWAYSYKDFVVTAEGTQADAQEVGRRLGAFDESLRALLRLPAAAAEPPTKVYALPQSALAGLDAVWSSQGGAFFRAGPFEDYLVLRSDASAGDQEIYAERTRALVASWGLGRLPDWYQHGIAQLMSTASFDHDLLTIGQDLPEQSARLAHGWIPMEEFLRLPASDPLLRKTPETEALYEAQCWWLVHLTVLDGVIDRAMPRYLQRLLMGESQEAAYAAAIGIQYEALDQYFKKLKRNIKLKQYTMALADAGTVGPPQQLSEAQAKARLAELLLVHDPHSAPGTQLANDALGADANDEQALVALTRRDLAARRFPQAQASVQQLAALQSLSATGHLELGMSMSTLAKSRDEGIPGTSGVDSKAMRAGARTHYRRAMELLPKDPQAPYQLGWLLCDQGDVAGVRELLPAVEAGFYRRPESVEFAQLLVRMNTITGNAADVFKYSVVEQRLATTDTERTRATDRVERLRAQLNSAQ